MVARNHDVRPEEVWVFFERGISSIEVCARNEYWKASRRLRESSSAAILIYRGLHEFSGKFLNIQASYTGTIVYEVFRPGKPPEKIAALVGDYISGQLTRRGRREARRAQRRACELLLA